MTSAVAIPQCGVCHKPYKYGGPAPYLLPCLHSVCEVCLDSDVDDAVVCSTCHEYILKFDNNFPHGCHKCLSQADTCSWCTECSHELTKLRLYCPKDAVTAKDLFSTTVAHFSSELLCTNRNDGNQAMSWCQKCEAFLCENCQASHEDMKATRSHVIVLTKDLALSDVERHDAQNQCTVHEGHPVELYDPNCNILICYKCSRTTHKDCIIESLEERMRIFKAEKIENQMKALTEKVKLNAETEQTMQHIETNLDEKKTELEDMVKHTFGELKCRLDQREEEIKFQLSLCVDLLRKENAENFKTVRAVKERCKAALEFSEKVLTISSPSSMFEMENTIDERNEACLSAKLPCVRSEAASLSFSRQELPVLKDVIARFGGFFTHLKDGADEIQKMEYLCVSKNKLDETFETERTLRAENASLSAELCTSKNKLDEVFEMERILRAEISSLTAELCTSNNEFDEIRVLEWTLRKENSSLKAELSSHLESKQKETDIISSINMSSLGFDTKRVNKAKVHVNSDLKLVNSDSPDGPVSRVRERFLDSVDSRKPFVTFVGTISTRPLSKTDVEYWETHIKVSIIKQLAAYHVLFEIGFCVENRIDNDSKVNDQPDSVIIYLRQCMIHNRICLRCKRDGQGGICLQQSFPNVVGTTATLKYGILTSPQKEQCTLFDVNTNTVLCSRNRVRFSKAYWPVFGVHNKSEAKVEMSCISGDIVQLNCNKTNLILAALL